MKVQPINNKILTPKTTGYAAAAGIISTIATGATKNKCIKRYHKQTASISALLVLLHIGLIEYNHYIWKNKQL